MVFGQKLWCFVKDGGCREWVKFSGEIGCEWILCGCNKGVYLKEIRN